MAAIIEALEHVTFLTDETPVVIGGLAVLSRLSVPYRATTDLDVVDRLRGASQLQLLRRQAGATPIEPAAVELPTSLGNVKIDVLEVRQIELDEPSDNPGDRLHASSHAWAYDTATDLRVTVTSSESAVRRVTARFAEPGPLIAMKLQALMDRTTAKQGTDLQDIVRLILDEETRPVAMEQLSTCDQSMASDIAQHVQLWLVQRRLQVLGSVRATGGADIGLDDVDLVAELLLGAL